MLKGYQMNVNTLQQQITEQIQRILAEQTLATIIYYEKEIERVHHVGEIQIRELPTNNQVAWLDTDRSNMPDPITNWTVETRQQVSFRLATRVLALENAARVKTSDQNDNVAVFDDSVFLVRLKITAKALNTCDILQKIPVKQWGKEKTIVVGVRQDEERFIETAIELQVLDITNIAWRKTNILNASWTHNSVDETINIVKKEAQDYLASLTNNAPQHIVHQLDVMAKLVNVPILFRVDEETDIQRHNIQTGQIWDPPTEQMVSQSMSLCVIDSSTIVWRRTGVKRQPGKWVMSTPDFVWENILNDANEVLKKMLNSPPPQTP